MTFCWILRLLFTTFSFIHLALHFSKQKLGRQVVHALVKGFSKDWNVRKTQGENRPIRKRSLERIRFSFTPLYPTFSFQRWLAISGFPKDYDRSSTFFTKKCIRRVFCRTKIPSGHLPLNTHFFQRLLLLRKPYINVSYRKRAAEYSQIHFA